MTQTTQSSQKTSTAQPIPTKWNLSYLQKSDDDPRFEKEMQEIELALNNYVKRWRNNPELITNHEQLKLALNEYETLKTNHGNMGNFGYYFYLRIKQDQNDPIIKAKYAKVIEFEAKMSTKLHFLSLTLGKISKEDQEKMLQNQDLSDYHYFLKSIFNEAKYFLTEEGEKIMSLKSNPSHNLWEEMTSALLSKEERQVYDGDKESTKNFSEFASMIDDQNEKTRESATKAFNETLIKYKDVATAEINAILTNKKIDDELRGLQTPDQGRILQDAIDQEFIDSLIKTVQSRYDISQRYYKLKAKLFGKEQLKYNERNLTYTAGKEEKSYNYEEAIKLVLEVFENLDPQFAKITKDFIENGNIDVHPGKGKDFGACCIHYTKNQPVYILLNHTDKLNDVLTLAHELGHGINGILMKELKGIYYDMPKSTAEVASTFFEGFVFQKLLDEADPETKLSLLIDRVGGELSTIIRQIACYQFELDLHNAHREKRYLSSEDIGEIFVKDMEAYMGEAVEQSELTKNWWVHWPHIRYFFYVYSYASGLLISKGLQAKVKQNHSFIEQVKDFLKSGASDNTRNIFAKTGIELNTEFWNQGLDELEADLNEAEKIAQDLGKI